MATYLRPGVFVEETLQPLAGIDADANDSIAAFVGTASQGGPVGPTLITSWTQYQALFGSIRTSRDTLAYALHSFFTNGGSSAYVVRAVSDDAVAASLTLNNAVIVDDPATVGVDESLSGDVAVLTATAKAPGDWASDPTSNSRVFVTVKPGTDGDRFDLTIEVGKNPAGGEVTARENFVDLTLNPNDARYALPILNSATIGSKFLKFKLATDFVYTGPEDNPAAVTREPLTGGTDGTGSPDLVAAVQNLETVDANLVLAVPGLTDTTDLSSIITWAEGRGNVFVVVDAPDVSEAATQASAVNTLTTFVESLPRSSYAAVYAATLWISDPASGVSGAVREVFPSGVVVGQYLRTETARGIQKAPAGIETSLRGVINTSYVFNDTSLDTLNQAGVNVIRSVPGAGLCIMGARTLSKTMPDRYINIRRTLQYLKRSLVSQTRFAVFEPNQETLWATISAVLTKFLTTEHQVGTLKGESAEEAFFVKCDEELNDPATVQSGTVKVEVGVAIANPAEFVVIRIGQFDGGATVEDVQD